MGEQDARTPVTLGALARVALWAGFAAFGGGFAVIAWLKREIVERRRWLDADAFVENIGVAGALPGTIVTNFLVLVGHRLRGAAGALLSPTIFVLPGCAIIAAIAWGYDWLHAVRWVRAALDGLNPAVAGLFAAIGIELGKDTLRTRRAWAVAIFAVVALAFPLLTLLQVVLLAGAYGILVDRPKPPKRPVRSMLVLPGAVGLGASAPVALTLLLLFARIGVATFGGGIAMVPAIEHEVSVRGWLDAQSFADAVAFGQVTPGPVGIMATFVGWRVAGPLGALAATVGVFAPPIALSLIAARSLAAFRENGIVQGFLRGVTPAVSGIIVAAAISVGRASVHGAVDVAVLLGCIAVRLSLPKTSPVVPLVLGALTGIARVIVAG